MVPLAESVLRLSSRPLPMGKREVTIREAQVLLSPNTAIIPSASAIRGSVLNVKEREKSKIN